MRLSFHVSLFPPVTSCPTKSTRALTETNFIDQHARARWKKLGLFPSIRCSDGDFIRRVSLDAIGRLPTVQETREFLAETGENKTRRAD